MKINRRNKENINIRETVVMTKRKRRYKDKICIRQVEKAPFGMFFCLF